LRDGGIYRGLRHRRYYNIKVYNIEIILEGLDWIAVAQGRKNCWAVVNMVINSQVHKMREIFVLAERMFDP